MVHLSFVGNKKAWALKWVKSLYRKETLRRKGPMKGGHVARLSGLMGKWKRWTVEIG